ncbi:alanine racemase [Pseudofulvibacter geojedonensis]|uniref:Alanine racemase n=1 Tax=Pseudofulvibacter geojedonensis TaxID=1123758 RepID=A0ABW3I118_9FLAO
MNHTSYIEISESAIQNNIDFIKQFLGDETIFSSVVKGNAYGHGINIYCPLAYKYGIRHFSVSDAHEAYELKSCLPNDDVEIMIMGMIENDQLSWAINNNISFYVFEENRLKNALFYAKKFKKTAQIHIEVETGMNRTGFEKSQITSIIDFVKSNSKFLKLKSVCSHLAGAESITNYKRISKQRKNFKLIKKEIKQHVNSSPLFHLASSAATIRYPKTQLDLVRIGILQFGYFPTKEILVHYFNKEKTFVNPLKRIVSWKSSVMDIKVVKSGEFIGYGTSYFTNEETTIAIIPVGYSSGYNRLLSNRGKVLINGDRFNVIGTVNMNMMAVDITHNKNIKKGDEVVLIGSQKEKEITVSSFNDSIQLINYELLTRLPKNLPRIITK